jgi:nucleotide-binding universal stress UspA family protein
MVPGPTLWVMPNYAPMPNSRPTVAPLAATVEMPRPTIEPRRPLGVLLLATDLSPASAAAEELAMDLAAGLGSVILLVSVIDPRGLRLPGGVFRERVDQARAARETAAQVIVERARHRGIPMRCLIWEGDPGEAIVEAAVAESVDLIVVGSHGRTGMDRLFMGSVSERVVRTSPMPVLVARTAAA